jgi:OOP family OmpA-OmpF porin
VFLERAAGFMKKLPPQVVVEVGGHTDSVGDDAPNKTLSDNRAKAVKAALIASGVAPEMLTEKGYGEEKPKATNDTEDGKFQNRRIEYTAVKK